MALREREAAGELLLVRPTQFVLRCHHLRSTRRSRVAVAGSTHRQPRDAFLPTIAKVVARMEATLPSVRASWKAHQLFGGREESATIALESLHVFGSFARGAPLCGDLDLIVTFVHSDGQRPSDRVVHNLSVGRTRGMDVVVAHRDEFDAKLAQFPETKLLWSLAEPDWRAHVGRIPLDSNADRFDRRTDQLPVSLKQIDFYSLEHVEKVLDAIDRRELVSTWVPHEKLVPAPEQWDHELQRALRVYGDLSGAKTRVVLPYVLQWMSEPQPFHILLRHSLHDRAAIHVNNVFAHMGRPALDVEALNRADISALVLAPHVSQRFPNGLWVLTRGPRHPVVKAAKTLRAWAHGYGRRPYARPFWPKDGYRLEYAAQLLRSTVRTGNWRVELRGQRLLDFIATTNAVTVGRQTVPVSGEAVDLIAAVEKLLVRGTRAARKRSP
jgi:hypothetical protein